MQEESGAMYHTFCCRYRLTTEFYNCKQESFVDQSYGSWVNFGGFGDSRSLA